MRKYHLTKLVIVVVIVKAPFCPFPDRTGVEEGVERAERRGAGKSISISPSCSSVPFLLTFFPALKFTFRRCYDGIVRDWNDSDVVGGSYAVLQPFLFSHTAFSCAVLQKAETAWATTTSATALNTL